MIVLRKIKKHFLSNIEKSYRISYNSLVIILENVAPDFSYISTCILVVYIFQNIFRVYTESKITKIIQYFLNEKIILLYHKNPVPPASFAAYPHTSSDPPHRGTLCLLTGNSQWHN